jgi:hypothetical protein
MHQKICLVAVVGAVFMCTSSVIVAANQAVVGKGEYLTNCASCHGTTGTGGGPVAASLNIKVTDLTQLAKNNAGEFPSARVYTVIDGRDEVQGHGSRDMPVWGDDYLAKTSRDEPIANREESVSKRIHALVDYLKAIQAK